jgi:hypothetical protein
MLNRHFNGQGAVPQSTPFQRQKCFNPLLNEPNIYFQSKNKKSRTTADAT